MQKFEAPCRSLDITTNENKQRWWDTLFCKTDPETFTTLATEIDAYNNIPYANLKTNIETKYFRESYERHLENIHPVNI